jgi:hypothetical protein
MIIREIEENDLEYIPDIFYEVYSGYSMHNIQISELYRPFAEKDKTKREYMFVVQEKNGLSGYVAFGVRQICSFVMVSIYDIVAFNKEAYDMLMKKVEEIGYDRGAAFIEIQVLAKVGVAAYLKDVGFFKTRIIAGMTYLLEMRELFRIFVENALKMPFKKDVTVLFCVGEEKIQLKLPDGSIDSDARTADIEIEISPHDLLSLFLKKSKCHTLILKGKMKVNPFHRMKSACKVIDYLSEDMRIVTLFEAFM